MTARHRVEVACGLASRVGESNAREYLARLGPIAGEAMAEAATDNERSQVWAAFIRASHELPDVIHPSHPSQRSRDERLPPRVAQKMAEAYYRKLERECAEAAQTRNEECPT